MGNKSFGVFLKLTRFTVLVLWVRSPGKTGYEVWLGTRMRNPSIPDYTTDNFHFNF
jgi:hypothetical protein